jgi:hypothetical protein
VRYRCPCGHEADEVPSAPDREIVSVYHIHHRADPRGVAEIVPMELIRTTIGSPEREPELAGIAK